MSIVRPATIAFLVPLPPPSLRANSRAHWATKKRDADAYSQLVYTCACESFSARVHMALGAAVKPWERAHVTYLWRYCGVAPDHGNLGGNTKVLQDCLQMAPRNGGRDRYYLGLVEDDKGIEAVYKLEKVAHKAQEGVYVEIERVDEHEHCHPEFHRCDGGGPGQAHRYK